MIKKIVSAVLLAALCVGSTTSVLAEDVSIPQSKEEPYYSETIYYTGEDLKKVEPIKLSNDENGTLVGVVEQKVYVSETTDKSGNVIDSHLMTKAEVEQYKAELVDKTPFDSSHIGMESTSKGTLTIKMDVFRHEDRTFTVYGNAKWSATSGSQSTAQGLGDDFLALTWGGNGELVQNYKTISGTYYSGYAISFSQAKADSYKGYCWQFNDLAGTNKMKNAYATVKLKKTYASMKNKKTSVKLTYIHTYQTQTGSISFSVGANGMAGGINLSSTSKQWQLQVDVPGLLY